MDSHSLIDTQILPLNDINELLQAYMMLEQVIQDEEYENLSTITSRLQQIISLKDNVDSKTTFDDLCQKLSNELNAWINHHQRFSQIKKANVNLSFADVLYKTALFIAHINPVNPKDPYTLENIQEIPLEYRVSTGDRHQFDVRCLVEALKREPISSIKNPLTKIQFNERDRQTITRHVDEYAVKNNIKLNLKKDIPIKLRLSEFNSLMRHGAAFASNHPVFPEESPGQYHAHSLEEFYSSLMISGSVPSQDGATTPVLPWESENLSHVLGHESSDIHPPNPRNIGRSDFDTAPFHSPTRGSPFGSAHDHFQELYDDGRPGRIHNRGIYSVNRQIRITLSNGNVVVGSTDPRNKLRVFRDNVVIASCSQQGEGGSAIAELSNGEIIVAGKRPHDHFRVYKMNQNCIFLERSWNQDNYAIHFMSVLADGNIAVGNRARNADIRIYDPLAGALVKQFHQVERSQGDDRILSIEDLFEKANSYQTTFKLDLD